MRLAVLASGTGSILQAMVQDGIEVSLVVVDRPCRATALAASAGIGCEVVERTEFGPTFDRIAYTGRLAGTLSDHGIDLAAMAGFGTILGPSIFDGVTVLNTHPSLLPAFPGWHAVADALAYGVKVTGCTVHVATPVVDAGPDPRPGGGAGPPRRHRRHPPRAHQGGGAAALPGHREGGHATRDRSVKALLSVYDKAGVVDLAAELHRLGWELLSSGGTARAVAEAGIPVTDVADLTGVPPILGHRVVTLHPKVHGGLLADTGDAEHVADMQRHGIEPIDLLVANLYPFRSDPSIELIDIGGPAMVRAAAKNHDRVGVVVDPADYDAVLAEIGEHGSLGAATRRRLARTAFAHTAAYDAAVVAWFDETAHTAASPEAELPETFHLALERVQELRYGENPHQAGARYREVGTRSWWDDVVQHQGLALSYLNLFDADAAWWIVHDLAGVAGRPAVAVIKHANPCGAAVAGSLAEAYQRAYDCDPRSAFGGIVAFSHPVDDATVAAVEQAAQADVVIAPGYGPGVVERLAAKRRNTRVLEAGPPERSALELRQLSRGYLVQQAPRFDSGRDAWQVVTARRPTGAEWDDAAFVWRVCGHVKSNAIVMARDGVAFGIGAGQQNRVEAGQLAAAKAAGRAKGGACASDAFFPFPDGLDAAVEAGCTVVIQPGGAMRDETVIARADELGMAMVLTGERHFLH